MAISLQEAIKTNGGESQLLSTLMNYAKDGSIDRAARGGFTPEVHSWFANQSAGKTTEQVVNLANKESQAVAASYVPPDNTVADAAYQQRLSAMNPSRNLATPQLGTPEYTNYLIDQGKSLGMNLEQYRIPTTASGAVASVVPGVVTSGGQTSTGNISNASAGIAGMGEYLNTLMKSVEDERRAIESQQKESQGFLKDLFKSQPSISQTRADIEARTGMKAEQFFADQKARVAEIDSLTQQYNALVAAKDQQIAQSYDKLASTNFINNQIAQINRNAAPELNRLSANVNAKAATMEALQGNFDRAQNYINQAVQDATADFKNKVDAFSMFYEMNQDTLTRLDTKYQTAFNAAFDIAKLQYQNDFTLKTKLADLQLSNPQVAINLNGTLEAAMSAIQGNPKSPDYLYKQAQIAATNRSNQPSGGGSSSGFVSSKVETDVRADIFGDGGSMDRISAGSSTKDKEFNRLRGLYSPAEVSDVNLKQLLGITTSTSSSGGFNTPAQGPAFVAQQQVQQPKGSDSLFDNPFNGLVDSVSRFLFGK